MYIAPIDNHKPVTCSYVTKNHAMARLTAIQCDDAILVQVNRCCALTGVVSKETAQDRLPMRFHIYIGIVSDRKTRISASVITKLHLQISAHTGTITLQIVQTLSKRVYQAIVAAARIAIPFAIKAAIDE